MTTERMSADRLARILRDYDHDLHIAGDNASEFLSELARARAAEDLLTTIRAQQDQRIDDMAARGVRREEEVTELRAENAALRALVKIMLAAGTWVEAVKAEARRLGVVEE